MGRHREAAGSAVAKSLSTHAIFRLDSLVAIAPNRAMATAISKGALAKLIADHEVGRVTRALILIIYQSFVEDGSRKTFAETQRRFDICIELFKMLRGDMHYSIERTLDTIPHALRCKLDRIPWEPSKRNTWFGQGEELAMEADDSIDLRAEPQDAGEPVLWTPERARLGIVS